MLDKLTQTEKKPKAGYRNFRLAVWLDTLAFYAILFFSGVNRDTVEFFMWYVLATGVALGIFAAKDFLNFRTAAGAGLAQKQNGNE